MRRLQEIAAFAPGARGVLRSYLDGSARRAIVVLLVVAAPFVIFWPTTSSLMQIWSDPLRAELSHGYLTLAIVGGLIWLRRKELFDAPMSSNVLALLTLIPLSLIWLFLVRASVQVLHQMLLPLLSLIFVCSVCGPAIAKRVAFPIGYLYLAMPIWTVLNTPLQWGSVWAVRTLLRVLGIPAYFSGTSIEVSAGVFEIADGCSGLRLLLVGLAIGILYGELQKASIKMRFELVVVAAVLSAVANWIRILIIIGAAHLYGIDHPLVGDHIWLGWLVFAAAMLLFFWIANHRLPALSDASLLQTATLMASPKGGWSRWVPHAALSLVMLSVGPVWALSQASLTRVSSSRTQISHVDRFERVDGSGDWQPRFVGADEQVRVDFVRDSRTTQLFLGTYQDQRQGKELTGYGNALDGDLSMRTLSQANAVREGVPHVRRIVIAPDGQHYLYWYSYQVGGRWLSKPLMAQLQYAWQSLWSVPQSRVVIARVSCEIAECATDGAAIAPVWDAAIRSLSIKTSEGTVL